MPYYIPYKKKKKKDEDLPLFKAAGVKVKKQPDLTKKLDKVFSEYIRLRDSKPFGFRMFKCISCGRILPYEQADCGHYFSRTHMATRFDEQNCHAECRHCNRFLADHLHGYERNLRAMLGDKKFALLEVRAHGVKKWSNFELEEMIKYFKAKIKELKGG